MEREPWFIEHYDAVGPAVPVVVAPVRAPRKVGYWRQPIGPGRRGFRAWCGWWLRLAGGMLAWLAVLVLLSSRHLW